MEWRLEGRDYLPAGARGPPSSRGTLAMDIGKTGKGWANLARRASHGAVTLGVPKEALHGAL